MAHAKAAGHLTVPNVQALAQTWNESGEEVPERYVRTEQGPRRGDRRRWQWDRSGRSWQVARPSVVGRGAAQGVCLSTRFLPGPADRHLFPHVFTILALSYFWRVSCPSQASCVQIINHGVPDEVIQDMRRDITEFFKLPLEAKEVYAQLPDSLEGIEGYGQAFVLSETEKLDWADMIYLMLRPTESRDMRFWPGQPPSLRNSIDRYSTETANVVSSLVRFMAADMGLKQPERLLEMFAGQPQAMRVSYYPPCRQAGKVIGLSPHTDACALTLLLHINDVQGLQIRRDDGKWLAVDPLDGALIVSIGDTFEILSNGRYRSVEHRAMVDPDKERISAAMFHLPCPTITVGPLPELVEGGAQARYKSAGYAEFVERFFATKPDGRRSNLEYYKI